MKHGSGVVVAPPVFKAGCRGNPIVPKTATTIFFFTAAAINTVFDIRKGLEIHKSIEERLVPEFQRVNRIRQACFVDADYSNYSH